VLGIIIEIFILNVKREIMKKIMSTIVLSALLIIVSTTAGFAQQAIERSKAELDVPQTERLKMQVRNVMMREDTQKKKTNTERTVLKRALIQPKPVRLKLETK
jgi:hypothetical protein